MRRGAWSDPAVLAAWCREVLAMYSEREMIGFTMDLNLIVAEAGLP